MLNKKLKHQEVKYITEDSSAGFKSMRLKTVFFFQQVFQEKDKFGLWYLEF